MIYPQNVDWLYGAVIRTYNSAATLGNTIASLHRQTIQPREIIVIDSGSNDETIAIATKNECKVLRYPETEAFNYSKAINIGISACSYEYILIISSHNSLVESDVIELLLCGVQCSELCGVYCRHIYQKDDGIEGMPLESPKWEFIGRENFSGDNALRNSCSLIRRDAWQFHHFDESLPTCEDQEFALWHYSNTGRKTALLSNRHVLCLNSRANYHKIIRDRVFIATYFYSEWRSPQQILRHIVRAFIFCTQGKFSDVMGMLSLALALTKSWFRKPDMESRYF